MRGRTERERARGERGRLAPVRGASEVRKKVLIIAQRQRGMVSIACCLACHCCVSVERIRAERRHGKGKGSHLYSLFLSRSLSNLSDLFRTIAYSKA